MSQEKTLLITVGATAPFPALTQAALSPSFHATLTDLHYTHLIIQTGPPTSTTPTPTLPSPPSGAHPPGLKMTLFGLTPSLTPHMADATTVVSHCGAGSVLEALRLGKKLVVVPNPKLMGGHQEELAQVLEEQGYAVWARLAGEEEEAEDGGTLSDAVRLVEGQKMYKRFPDAGEGLGGVLEVEMGLMGVD